jgi:hypothetical protein
MSHPSSISPAGPDEIEEPEVSPKVSANTRRSVIDPDNPLEDFLLQPSFGLCWHPNGGSVVTNHRSWISLRDAETLCSAEQIQREEKDNVVSEHNLDPATAQFSKEQLTQMQWAVETKWADLFEQNNKLAKRGANWAENESHFFVAPDGETLYLLETARGCVKVKENGHWNAQSWGITSVMDEYRDRLSGVAPPQNIVDDGAASATWSALSSEVGDVGDVGDVEDETHASAEDSDPEDWQDAEEGG